MARTSLASERRESIKQTTVEGRESQSGDRARQEPANFGDLDGASYSRQDRAAVDAKVDVGTALSRVETLPDFFSHCDREPELLLNFSSKGFFLSLARFDFAPGKLPETAEVRRVVGSSSKPHSSVILEQARNDEEGRGGHGKDGALRQPRMVVSRPWP